MSERERGGEHGRVIWGRDQVGEKEEEERRGRAHSESKGE